MPRASSGDGLDVDHGVRTGTLEAQNDPLLCGYQPEAIEAPRAVLLLGSQGGNWKTWD